MGYRIQYDTVGKRKFRSMRDHMNYRKLLIILVVAALSISCILLREHLLPADAQVTAALEGLADSIREGSSLSDAVEAFCVQILEGADAKP